MRTRAVRKRNTPGCRNPAALIDRDNTTNASYRGEIESFAVISPVSGVANSVLEPTATGDVKALAGGAAHVPSARRKFEVPPPEAATAPLAEFEKRGSRAGGSVPLAIFEAFVVSVVADSARPDTLAAGRLPVTIDPRFTAPQEGAVPPMSI